MVLKARSVVLLGASLSLGVPTASSSAAESDLGFRLRKGVCVDDAGHPGENTMTFAAVSASGFGECADFRGQTLQSVRAIGADLRGADFSGARLDFVELNKADLRHARFTGVVSGYLWLNDADLRGADLRMAQADTTWNFIFDDCTILPDVLGETIDARRNAVIARGGRYEPGRGPCDTR